MKKRRLLSLFVAAAMGLSVLTACGASANADKEEKTYEGSYGEKIEAFYEDHKDTAAGMSVAVFDKDGVIYKNYFEIAWSAPTSIPFQAFLAVQSAAGLDQKGSVSGSPNGRKTAIQR